MSESQIAFVGFGRRLHLTYDGVSTLCAREVGGIYPYPVRDANICAHCRRVARNA